MHALDTIRENSILTRQNTDWSRKRRYTPMQSRRAAQVARAVRSTRRRIEDLERRAELIEIALGAAVAKSAGHEVNLHEVLATQSVRGASATRKSPSINLDQYL